MVLELLVRRVDEEDLKELIPAEDLPLLTSILKAERRKENAKSKSEEGEEKRLSRTRWIKEGEDPLDLLNVEDITRGITSRKEEEDDSEEVHSRAEVHYRLKWMRMAVSSSVRKLPRLVLKAWPKR